MADDFACYSALLFDDETLSIQLLHRGTKESCEKCASLIDALSYNGPKRVVESCVRWMPWEMYEEGIRAAQADTLTTAPKTVD